MDKKVIIEAMGYIDPKLIQEAAAPKKNHRSKIRSSLLIAACISLLLLTTVFAASVFFEIPDIHIDKSGRLIGVVPTFDKQTGGARVSVDQFSDAFMDEIADYSWDKSYYYYFDSWDELEEYIGFNLLDNTSLNQAKRNVMYFGADAIESHGSLHAQENDGKLASLQIVASYQIAPAFEPTMEVDSSSYSASMPCVNVTVTAAVYTQYSLVEGDKMFSSYYYSPGTEIKKESYVSANGKTYTIACVDAPNLTGVYCFGFVCINKVYITVKTYYVDEEIALSTLKEILDGFVIR